MNGTPPSSKAEKPTLPFSQKLPWKRRLLSVPAFLLWLATPSPGSAQAPPAKYALVIGLNEYLHVTGITQLDFAEADAIELSKALTGQGYKVHTVTNANATRERVIAELSRYAASVAEADDFLLYFAGHGVRNKPVNSKTYWLTYNSELEALDVYSIRLRHLIDYVMEIKAKRKLILLDHCYSGDVVASINLGSGPRSSEPPGPGGPPLQRGVFPAAEFNQTVSSAGEGLVVIAAARGDAFELKDLKHGVFTAALLKALTTREADSNPRDARLSMDELRTYLGTQVPILAKQAQQVTDLTNGTNTRDWIVADQLPVDDDAEATKKADTYKRKLSDWEQRHWIKIETRNRCWEVLVDWTDGLKAGKKLTEGEQNVLNRIREAMEATTPSERVRADALDVFVQDAIRGTS